jgi:hypothetical protein
MYLPYGPVGGRYQFPDRNGRQWCYDTHQDSCCKERIDSMNYEPESRPEDCCEISNIPQLHSIALNAFFSRYRRVFHSIAYRVLFNHRDADSAVQNLFLSASHNIPRFECEGSFRSWLLRGLIDEALAILHKNRSRSTSCSCPLLDPLNFLPLLDPAAKKLRRHRSDKRLTSAELH